uniref:Uncharacterized protein n=1 Tax=Erpetoichthys calabaricus TaxID=27687 RepID=A0A8C4T216_ERPCA
SVTLALLLVRLLSRTPHLKCFCATVNACCKEDYGKGPLKFSGSKADPRYWKVEKSLGSSYLRAWWTVLPISILGLVTIFWCFVREEKEVDQKLIVPPPQPPRESEAKSQTNELEHNPTTFKYM